MTADRIVEAIDVAGNGSGRVLAGQEDVLVEVVSRPRSREEKLAFYKNLCDDLDEKCHISSEDVMVSFVLNSDADWSFGLGRAQFLTGEL